MRCKACGEHKPSWEFYWRFRGRYAHQPCKACFLKKQSAYDQDHREERSAWSLARAWSRPGRIAALEAKLSKIEIALTLTLDRVHRMQARVRDRVHARAEVGHMIGARRGRLTSAWNQALREDARVHR